MKGTAGAAGWRCAGSGDKHRTTAKGNWMKIGQLQKKSDVEAREVRFS